MLSPDNIKQGDLFLFENRLMRSYKPPYLFIELNKDLSVMKFKMNSKREYDTVRIIRSRFNELKAISK